MVSNAIKSMQREDGETTKIYELLHKFVGSNAQFSQKICTNQSQINERISMMLAQIGDEATESKKMYELLRKFSESNADVTNKLCINQSEMVERINIMIGKFGELKLVHEQALTDVQEVMRRGSDKACSAINASATHLTGYVNAIHSLRDTMETELRLLPYKKEIQSYLKNQSEEIKACLQDHTVRINNAQANVMEEISHKENLAAGKRQDILQQRIFEYIDKSMLGTVRMIREEVKKHTYFKLPKKRKKKVQ